MKWTKGIVLLAVAVLAGYLRPRPVLAQACKDEEGIVADYQKSITELADIVKKESLADFQKAYHQKNFQTKLTLCISMVNGLVTCLDKASQDTTATKEEVDAYKAKRDRFAKLKDTAEQDRKTLKATEAAKEAKALIEKFDLSK